MDSSKFMFLFLLSSAFLVCSSGTFLSYQARHDFMNPPFTGYPTTVTNPATTTAPDTSTPPQTTVPSANPAIPTPFPPTTDPANPQIPITNPVTTPTTTTFSGGQQYPNPTTPTTTAFPGGQQYPTPPAVTNPAAVAPPAVPGQSQQYLTPDSASGEFGTPPAVMNPSNPATGGGGMTEMGEIPPPSASISSSLKPFIGCITMAVSIITAKAFHGV